MEGAKYNLIYEYYKCHILFGHLWQGDFLPTIEQIGDAFQVAPQTVRNALKKLQNDGLISVSPGRNTIVIYETTPKKTLRLTREYYLARKEAMEDVYHIANLLLMPLYYEGCKRLDEHDMLRILYAAKLENANIASISMDCCNMMMDKINNWLAKSLFLDMVSFFQFPYVYTFDEATNMDYIQAYQQLLASCEALDREGVFRAFTGIQAVTYKTLWNYIEEAAEEMPMQKQIPFHWPTYRGRPQHCHTLAATIIHRIIDGRYVEKDMLPSYEKMSEEFQVSVNTARRTVGLLRDMGLIHSINGVGNQILPTKTDWKKIRQRPVQKIADMAGACIEILLITSNNFINKGFPNLSDCQIENLKKILSGKDNRCALAIAILIAEYVTVIYPTDIVLEIYSKLLEPLLLTYPLLLNRRQAEDKGSADFIEMMERALDGRDAGLFAEGFIRLLNHLRTDIEKLRLTLRNS